MNKKSLLLRTCVLVLTACATPRPNKENMVACGPGTTKVINIVATPGQFSVAPPRLCIDEEDLPAEIKVNFAGNHDPDVITIAPKTGVSAPWLNASTPGTNPDQTTITVPAGTATDTYLYNVTAIGWGVIDPMISVD